MNWDIVLRIAGILGGLAVASLPVVLPWQIRKSKAETGKVSADAAAVLTEKALKMLDMLEPAQQEVDRLEARLKAANDRANQLELDLQKSQAEVQDLRNQVTAMTKEVIELRAENSSLKGGGA
jgi:septal ring factor EnvC (AmiA/AmiB activator)